VVEDKIRGTYTDADAMYRDFGPDAVLVTMEPWRMPEPIMQALDSGAHVFHEKPGYVEIEDYRAIYQLARSRDRHLCIAYGSRKIPVVHEARRMVAEGMLGDLFAVHSWFVADHERTWQSAAPRPEYDEAAGGWFFSKEKAGGGHLVILGCHYLDLLRYITGANFKSVAAMCKNVGGESITADDAAMLTIEFDNGMLGSLNSGYYTSSAEYGRFRHNGIYLFGREGWLRFNPGGALNEPLEWSTNDGVGGNAPLKSWVVDEKGHGDHSGLLTSYAKMTSQFFRACRGEDVPPLEPEAGMWVNECISAAYTASDTGQVQPVSIPGV
jgi:predicted dehydrogenase